MPSWIIGPTSSSAKKRALGMPSGRARVVSARGTAGPRSGCEQAVATSATASSRKVTILGIQALQLGDFLRRQLGKIEVALSVARDAVRAIDGAAAAADQLAVVSRAPPVSLASRGSWAGAGGRLRTSMFVDELLIVVTVAPELGRPTCCGQARRGQLVGLRGPFRRPPPRWRPLRRPRPAGRGSGTPSADSRGRS